MQNALEHSGTIRAAHAITDDVAVIEASNMLQMDAGQAAGRQGARPFCARMLCRELQRAQYWQ